MKEYLLDEIILVAAHLTYITIEIYNYSSISVYITSGLVITIDVYCSHTSTTTTIYLLLLVRLLLRLLLLWLGGGGSYRAMERCYI